MPKFYLPTFWKTSAFHIIEADTLEQAQEIADDPNGWEGSVNAHLDLLPDPQQETSRDDYEIFPDQIREATPEEIALAENGSDREALRECLEALRYACQEMDEQLQIRPFVQCSVEKHGDLGDRGEKFGSLECVCLDSCAPLRAAIARAEKVLGAQ